MRRIDNVLRLADIEQQRVQFGAFTRVETGCRFVETQKFGISAHGACNLEPALGAIGKVASGIVRPFNQANAFEPEGCLVDRRLLCVPIALEADDATDRETGRRHQLVMLGNQQVLETGHAGEQADVLERAGDACDLVDAVVGQALQQECFAIAAAHRDHADGRFVEAG
jgi:hypothetical protein